MLKCGCRNPADASTTAPARRYFALPFFPSPKRDRFPGPRTDLQGLRYLFIGEALDRQLHHLPLAFGKLIDARGQTPKFLILSERVVCLVDRYPDRF